MHDSEMPNCIILEDVAICMLQRQRYFVSRPDMEYLQTLACSWCVSDEYETRICKNPSSAADFEKSFKLSVNLLITTIYT